MFTPSAAAHTSAKIEKITKKMPPMQQFYMRGEPLFKFFSSLPHDVRGVAPFE